MTAKNGTLIRLLAAALALVGATQAHASPPKASRASGYIVETRGQDSATQAVRRAGGRITHELPIIHGVSALLTPRQAARLRRNSALQLFADSAVQTQGSGTA